MKKTLAIALVAVLMLSLLTACSGGNSNTPSDGGNSTNPPSNSSTPSGNGGDPTSNPTSDPASTNGGDNSGGNTEAINQAVEKIETLMKGAGYNGTLSTEKDAFSGAEACLYFSKTSIGMLQVYFYSSDSAAESSYSSVMKPTADDLDMGCEIKGNIIYTGNDEFVTILDDLLK